MKQHLPMMTLSDREKELIKNFLHEAYLEGGRGLWLVAKKFVTVSYWFHMLTYEGRVKEYTVWNIIRRMYGYKGYRPGNINSNIVCEVACLYPWEQIDDNDPLWEGNYRSFKIKTILDKNPLSMKQFYEELNQMFNTAREEADMLKRMNIDIQQPVIDTPF